MKTLVARVTSLHDFDTCSAVIPESVLRDLEGCYLTDHCSCHLLDPDLCGFQDALICDSLHVLIIIKNSP